MYKLIIKILINNYNININYIDRVGLFLMGRNGTLPNPAWKSFYKWSSII